MAIRAVVFDIGGVLESTPETGWVERWEARLQLEPGELVQRLGGVFRDGSLGLISERAVEEQVGELFDLSPEQVTAFMADLWHEYLGQLNAELAAFFASLRPRYRTAMLSNSFVGARAREEERYGFGALCDLIIYSHEEGIEKPDPAIFALTCERLGLRSAEILFVDDSETHVAAARQLGMPAVRFHDTSQAIAELNALLDGG